MAIYKEPFVIQLKPNDYKLKEKIGQQTVDQFENDLPNYAIHRDFSRHGTQLSIFDDDETQNISKVVYGGHFDWGLATYPDYKEESNLIKVQLMRLWTIQMVQQMLHGKSYVNEANSKIKMDLEKDELVKVSHILDKLTNSIHNEMESINENMYSRDSLKKFQI